MEIEHLERRFGVTAVKKGYTTSDQLVETLAIQIAEDISTGDHDPIGNILYEQRILTIGKINEVLGTIKKKPDEQ